MSTTRILVVDDDPVGAAILSRMLGDEPGFEVDATGDGAGAIAAIEASSPDLVMLDLVMPGLDGLDVVRNLRGRPETRDVPIIVVTASDCPTEQVRALDAGADDLLTKPYRREDLVARVRVQLRHQMRRLELGAAATASERRCRRLRRFDDRRKSLVESVVAEMRAAVSAMQLHLDALDQECDEAVRLTIADRLQALEVPVIALRERAAELIDVAGLEPVALVPRPASFAPAVMIGAWLRELEPRLGGDRRLRVRIDDHLPDVHTDPGLLRRALRGVVLHAAASSGARAVVEVCVTAADRDRLEVAIDDGGSSLPGSLRRQLLDDHGAVGRGSADLIRHGIGLTFARLAADTLGGRLAAEAREEGAVRYLLSLPVAVEAGAGMMQAHDTVATGARPTADSVSAPGTGCLAPL